MTQGCRAINSRCSMDAKERLGVRTNPFCKCVKAGHILDRCGAMERFHGDLDDHFLGRSEEKDLIKVISLFELIGLGILIMALRETLAWLRFGRSVFELASIPGVIGGTLEGQIHTGIKNFPKKPVLVSLTCIRTRRVKRHKETDTTTDVIWQTDRDVEAGRFVRGLYGLRFLCT